MHLHKLPLYTSSDYWLVPTLIPDNYDKMMLPTEHKENYAGYLHDRHILSRALILADIPTALDAVELCIEWLHAMESKRYPAMRNMGVCSPVTRRYARYSNWAMEEACLTHIYLSLCTQHVFSKLKEEKLTDADVDRALMLAMKMADLARSYPSDRLPIFASTTYYMTLQRILQLARYYYTIVASVHSELSPAKNAETVPRYLLCVADDVSGLEQTTAPERKPISRLAELMGQVGTAFELAELCYTSMTIAHQQPGVVIVGETTYLPLFKFVIDCRTVFNVLRHVLAGGCYERLLSDPNNKKRTLENEEFIVRQMGAIAPAIDILLSSPSILLSLDRMIHLKLYEELAKKSPPTIASASAFATGMLPLEYATINWYLRALDINMPMASSIVKQQDLAVFVDWARKVSFKLRTNLTNAYQGTHQPAEKIAFNPMKGSSDATYQDGKGYISTPPEYTLFPVSKQAREIIKSVFVT